MTDSTDSSDHHAWNPGLDSTLPGDLLLLSTLFRPENISNTLPEIRELSDFSGIPMFDLAALRLGRLLAHEVLIRVSADLTVPDGPKYEDLGINMRAMVSTLLSNYIKPELPALEEKFQSLMLEVSNFLTLEVKKIKPADAIPVSTIQPSVLDRVLWWRRPSSDSDHTQPVSIDDQLQQWSERSTKSHIPLESACLDTLVGVVNTIVATRGTLVGDEALIVKLTRIQVLNTYGSAQVGKLIEPTLAAAYVKEGFRLLPVQSDPYVMNVKGASASGKSTIRAKQRALAERIGVPWSDFALISPDYWRKFLLDYDSLGENYKYAGALTGHELAIVDQKLDHYMSTKAQSGGISHLLIDRFRFDSFASEDERESGTRLLTRFGKTVFLFFMVTPPDATVERAWIRGLETGRFKSVDDLLFHNVEAYTGMPQLFFSWINSSTKYIHFEFLDNSVEKGQPPRTIASGWNSSMTIYDINAMLEISRFKHININAAMPEEVYLRHGQDSSNNREFLQECVKRLDQILFVNPGTGSVYGEIKNAEWLWFDKTLSPKEHDVPGLLDLRKLINSSGKKTSTDLLEEAMAKSSNVDIGEKL